MTPDAGMKRSYNITILVPGMPFQGDTLESKSLGGSETAGLCMARELKKLGHTVTMFTNTDAPGYYDGVCYRPTQHWHSYVTTTPHDIAIVQRTPEPMKARLASKVNILWCHDMALGRQTRTFRGAMWNIHKVITLSKFHREQYASIYDLPPEALWQSSNGIDLDRFKPSDEERNRKRLIYSARPERGLDVMLDIFARILDRDPEFTLDIYGYDNPVEHMQAFYSSLAGRAARFAGKVKFAGQLTKDELYAEYARAGIYTYPTPSPTAKDFREISCISMMEAQASGLPIVTSRAGALPETVGRNSGVLLTGDPWHEEYQERFADEVVRLANDPIAYDKASKAGRRKAKSFGWDKVAEEWSGRFDGLFDELNDDPIRLARHFIKRSDIEAAGKALAPLRTEEAKELKAEIAKQYGFMESDEAFAEHYRSAGEGTDVRLSASDIANVDFENTGEKRFHALREILESQSQIETILDYGCGHGWCDIYLHNKVGRKWTGVDIDPGAVKWSRAFADAHARAPAAMDFIIGDHKADLGGPYDCLLISEVLEHVRDPYEVIDALEKRVKPGGLVIVTVPYGPSEYYTPNWHTFRNHIREFEFADLEDIFEGKPGVSIDGQLDHINEALGDPTGFYVVTYKADHKPVGRIDMTRKLRVQAPRQTISASIIAGPGAEDMLRWCLKSIRPVVDEIIVADTGMNEYATEICQAYDCRIVPAPSPLVEGFETPRNEGLAHCRGDWVLWIDTDEKLLDPQNLPKYARENIWTGLSIHQHHFSVDADFKPDMPVRMFRRRDIGGEQMRFFGMIHEHPELGLNKGPGSVLVLPDVNIAHVGYLNETTRRKRFFRNSPLLQRDMVKYPERVLQKHFIMRDLSLENMYEFQNNGEQVTDMMKARAVKIRELYREHFLGKSLYTNIDSLEYYTGALRLLGEGIDVSFSIAAGRDGQGDQMNGGTVARFANAEEAIKEIGWRLTEKIKPLLPEIW